MNNSFLENAGGYTPVPDKLVREYDYTTAYVWGKVWRYCQMQSGTCTASHETIANRAGMSRRTLIEKLNILIKDGYIEDLTPELKNKPHTYCTKIGEAKITSAMQNLHTENNDPVENPQDSSPSQSHFSMRNLHSDDAKNAQPDSPTVQDSHSHYANSAQSTDSTMQNLHSKKESINPIESNSISGKPPPKNGLPPGNPEAGKLKQAMVYKLSQVCKINLNLASGKQKGQLGTMAESLVKTGVSPPQLDKFIEWWTANDWRGKKGQAPEPGQIGEEWDRFEDSLKTKKVKVSAL